MAKIDLWDGWDISDNNVAVYGSRQLSGKEIVVAIDKVKRADIWCLDGEGEKVQGLLDELKKGDDGQILVMKGVHADKYSQSLGLHITVKLVKGCYTGETYHLYGRISDGVGGAWEIGFVGLYNPMKNYRSDKAVKIQKAEAEPAVIVVAYEPMPLTREQRESGLAVITERS